MTRCLRPVGAGDATEGPAPDTDPRDSQDAARARLDYLFRKCGTRACAELRRAVEDFRMDQPA